MVPYSTMLFRLHHLLLALSLVILNLSLDSFLNACVDILNFLHFASIDQTVHFLKEICPSFYALSIFNNLYDSKPLISRLNLLKYLQVYCWWTFKPVWISLAAAFQSKWLCGLFLWNVRPPLKPANVLISRSCRLMFSPSSSLYWARRYSWSCVWRISLSLKSLAARRSRVEKPVR